MTSCIQWCKHIYSGHHCTYFAGLKSPSHNKEPLTRNDSVSKKKDKKKEKTKKKKKWLDRSMGTSGKRDLWILSAILISQNLCRALPLNHMTELVGTNCAKYLPYWLLALHAIGWKLRLASHAAYCTLNVTLSSLYELDVT